MDSFDQTINFADLASADINMLDRYVEGMYEEISDKHRSSFLLMQLAKDHQNLSTLSGHDALLSSMSRVLVEDGRKNLDITSNILFIFHQMASFQTFHPVLTRNKVGDTTIKVLEREIDRGYLLKTAAAVTEKSMKISDESLQKTKQFCRKQDRVFQLCVGILLNFANDIGVQVKILKRNIVENLIRLLHLQVHRSIWVENQAPNGKQYSTTVSSVAVMDGWVERSPLIRPQNDVIATVLEFLLQFSIFNEGKDRALEDKELGKQLTEIIGAVMLSTGGGFESNTKQLAQQILLNLSHDQRAKRYIIDQPLLVSKLITSLASVCGEGKVSEPENKECHLRLLYQITMDEYSRNIVQSKYPDLISVVMKLLLNPPKYGGELISLEEVGGLACQLALSKDIVSTICGQIAVNGAGLKLILKRALKAPFSDFAPLFWKLLRIISASGISDIQMIFLEFLDEIMKSAVKSFDGILQSQDRAELIFVEEMLGICANLRIEGFDWVKLCENYPKLMQLINQQLSHSIAVTRESMNFRDATVPLGLDTTDGVLIAVVSLVGTMVSYDEAMIAMILNENGDQNLSIAAGNKIRLRTARISAKTCTMELLCELLHTKIEDDEILLQILYVLHGCLINRPKSFTEWLINYQQITRVDVVQILLDLWRDDRPQIRSRCDLVLDLLDQELLNQITKIAHDRDMIDPLRYQAMSRIRYSRFLWSNYGWALKCSQKIAHECSDDTLLLEQLKRCLIASASTGNSP